jgi:hypothetical protein
VIQIHSKVMYQRYYDSFMTVFVDWYCEARERGNSQEGAFIVAKIRLQDYITTEMLQNKTKTQLILKVYTDIKKDQKTYEKAIKHFERFKSN